MAIRLAVLAMASPPMARFMASAFSLRQPISNQPFCGEANEYGFYYIGKSKYVNEFGNEIFEKPDMVESFGVATITGIAYKVRKELIIQPDLFAK